MSSGDAKRPRPCDDAAVLTPALTYSVSVQQDPAGDVVVFEMLAGTHRVVSSSFSAPCAVGGEGYDTQEVTVAEGTESGGQEFRYTVTQYGTPL